MAEKRTTELVEDALDEYRALLWAQHEKLSRLLHRIEGEIQKIDDASSVISPRPVRRIVDFIVQYLETRKHAATEDEIVEAMVKVGAAAGRRDSVRQIRDSINANMAPRHRTPKLKRVNKLVGLFEWGDDKFRSP